MDLAARASIRPGVWLPESPHAPLPGHFSAETRNIPRRRLSCQIDARPIELVQFVADDPRRCAVQPQLTLHGERKLDSGARRGRRAVRDRNHGHPRSSIRPDDRDDDDAGPQLAAGLLSRLVLALPQEPIGKDLAGPRYRQRQGSTPRRIGPGIVVRQGRLQFGRQVLAHFPCEDSLGQTILQLQEGGEFSRRDEIAFDHPRLAIGHLHGRRLGAE